MTATKASITVAGLLAGVLAFGAAAEPANAQYFVSGYYGGYCAPPVYVAPPVYYAPPVYAAPCYPRVYGYYGGGYYRPYCGPYARPYYGRSYGFGFGYRRW